MRDGRTRTSRIREVHRACNILDMVSRAGCRVSLVRREREKIWRYPQKGRGKEKMMTWSWEKGGDERWSERTKKKGKKWRKRKRCAWKDKKECERGFEKKKKWLEWKRGRKEK